MAAAFVQSGQNATVANPHTTEAVTLTGVGAGALLIAGCVIVGADANTITFSDDNGGTWTTIGTVTRTGDSHLTYAYSLNHNSGNTTITATFTGITYSAMIAHEVSGVATSGALDGNNQTLNVGTSGTVTSGNFTTAADGDYIFGMVVERPGKVAIYVAGTGFTLRAGQDNGAAWTAYRSEDQIQASAGSIAATFAPGTFDDWLVVGAGFKAAAAAGSKVSPRSLALLGVGS